MHFCKVFLFIFIGAIIQCQTAPVQNESPTLIILGCIHTDHKDSKFYSDMRLNEIFNQVHPDLIGLELPIDFFHDGIPNTPQKMRLESTTINESNIAWKYCTTHHIPCRPYDIYGRNTFYKETDFLNREDNLFKHVLSFLDTKPIEAQKMQDSFNNKSNCSRESPEKINSQECDDTVKTNHLLQKKYTVDFLKSDQAHKYNDKEFFEIQNNEWARRTQAMAENICKFAQDKKYKKILITVGFEHRSDLIPTIKSYCPEVGIKEFWQD